MNFADHVFAILRRMESKIDALTQIGAKIMSAEDNLKAAVADLSQKMTDHDVAVQAGIQALKDALAANDQAGIQAAADTLSGLSSKIADETAAINAAVNPPPAATPPAA